ncbi:hypothetical protein FS749_001940 [Ceratobasidium sp. UAMH 11750]|nr:hypothetical protein FS749_001940 [Ceratobasidium sp. UAMH 11750]
MLTTKPSSSPALRRTKSEPIIQHYPLVAIHRLPPEVLGSIFLRTVLSYSCFEKPGGWKYRWNALTTIPSVCNRWRRVATSIRALWNHVDLDAGHGENEKSSQLLLDRTQLWLERARGIPIHLHFLTSFHREPPPHIAMVVSTLQPHIPLVTSLVCPHGLDIGVANALFPLWGNLAQPTSLETLRLKGMCGSDAPVPWALILQGLTDLQLVRVYGANLPTFDQLAQVMLDSPRLHTLRLKELWGPPIVDSGHKYAPIKLGDLRLLDIMSSDRFLAPLLSLLSTGPLPLDLRIRTDPDPERNSVIASFLERSKVASLAIDYGYKDDFTGEAPPIEWTSQLSHMRMLVMSCMWTNGPTVDKLVTSTNGKPAARFPNLHTLVLFHCRRGGLARRRIEQMVNAYSLRRIIFVESYDAYLRDELSGTFSEDEDDGEDNDEDALGFDKAYRYTSDLGTWLNERVDTVVFEYEYYWPGLENEKWDPYAKELMMSLDA